MGLKTARERLLAATAAVCGGAFLLRLWLNLTRTHLDQSVIWRLLDTLSYFTILSNVIAAAVCIAALVRPASRLARPAMFASGSIYLLVTAVTYQLLLRGDPHGLALVADIGLHVVGPLLFIVVWLVFTPSSDLRWSHPLAWLIVPAVYTLWTLERGALTHRYPYFFADADRLGYPRALMNAAVFLVVFYLLGLGAVAIGRRSRSVSGAERLSRES